MEHRLRSVVGAESVCLVHPECVSQAQTRKVSKIREAFEIPTGTEGPAGVCRTALGEV